MRTLEATVVAPSEIEPPSGAGGEEAFQPDGALSPWIRKASGLLALVAAITYALSRTGIADHGAGAWSWAGALGEDALFASALLAAFVLAFARTARWAERAATVLSAIPLYFAFARLAPPNDALHLVWRASAALGASGVLLLGASVLRSRGEARKKALDEFLLATSLVGTFALLPFFAALTAAFRPLTLDAYAYEIDGALGLQPSALVGRYFANSEALRGFFSFVYGMTPAAIAFVHLARARSHLRDRGELLLTIFALTGAAVVCHHLVPIAGPVYAFPSFPEMPAVVWQGTMMAQPVPRIGMPSLPMAWALALYWHSRGMGAKMRGFGFAWLALTIVGALGFGFHYLIDLVVAVPFTAALTMLVGGRTEATSAWRAFAIVGLVALVAAWVGAFHIGYDVLASSRAIPFVAVLLTAILPWELERRWARAKAATRTVVPRRIAGDAPLRGDARLVWAMGAMFFVSGAAGLVYEVVFAKSLALTFGSTSRASTTVLATYMGGMAAGAWLGGRLARSKIRPLVIYALCEGGVALWCALSPLFLPLIQRIYVAIAAGADPSASWLGGLQVFLGALVLLPPTLLMGVTLPIVAKQFEKTMALGSAIGLLYGANTLGAALSSLCTGYFALPWLGIAHTTWLAVAANLGAALLALGVDKRFRLHEGRDESTMAKAPPKPRPEVETSRFEPLAAAIVLTVGGVVTLALEVVYIHLLAVVAGNSTYAFSLMLFAFLLGLGGGAAIGRKLLENRARALRYLAWMQFGLAACVLAGIFGWEAIPDYFASFGRYSLSRSFGARELIRAAVCCLAMIPPALFIGAAYPLAMACRVERAPDPIRATGRASALNTLGNVTGAFLGAFVLVPNLGALRSLHLLAATALALGLLAAFATRSIERWKAALPAAIVVLSFLAQPSAFNLNRLASGANVYFHNQGYGKVVDHAESADGGLTMVTEMHDQAGKRVLTLLTNGKFQGDDSKTREMAAQQGFALFPLLHTTARDRALVIGFGTGVSARTVSDAGFGHTDIVELSGDIYRLADQYFGSVNGGVLHRPNVEAHTTDGRNFLLLTENRYDVIGLELSSIWFAGAANLYNREFYQLVKGKLREGGVLQQWVQLHRLSAADIASIFASVRAEFEYVWLYYGGHQGIIVACAHDCSPTPEALAKIDETQALHPALASYDGTATGLLGARLLDPRGITAFLQSFGRSEEALVSTDDNLFLEYSTPKGNVRPWSSIRENVRMLERFR